MIQIPLCATTASLSVAGRPRTPNAPVVPSSVVRLVGRAAVPSDIQGNVATARFELACKVPWSRPAVSMAARIWKPHQVALPF